VAQCHQDLWVSASRQGSMLRRGQGFTLPGLALAAVVACATLGCRWDEAFVPSTPRLDVQRSFLQQGASISPQASEVSAPLAAAAMMSVAALSFGLVRRSQSPADHRQSSVVRLRAEAAESAKKEDEEEEEEDDEEFEDDDDDDEDELTEEDPSEDGLRKDNFDEVLQDRGYFEDEDDDADFDDYQDSIEDEYRIAKAWAPNLKGSPMKFERCLYQIRGRSYRDALMMLEFLPWNTAKPVMQVVQQAGQRAEALKNMDKSRLFIWRAQAFETMRFKRLKIASKGQGRQYWKKKSQVEIALKEYTDKEIEEMDAYVGAEEEV